MGNIVLSNQIIIHFTMSLHLRKNKNKPFAWKMYIRTKQILGWEKYRVMVISLGASLFIDCPWHKAKKYLL